MDMASYVSRMWGQHVPLQIIKLRIKTFHVMTSYSQQQIKFGHQVALQKNVMNICLQKKVKFLFLSFLQIFPGTIILSSNRLSDSGR
jgi:hypothetical protein